MDEENLTEPKENGVEKDKDDSEDSPSIAIQRSQSDAHSRLKNRRKTVRFRSLEHIIPGKQDENNEDDIRLLSAQAHQIGRANWCGGWQNTILARRKEGICPCNMVEEMQEITSAMEQDKRLMADSIDGQIHRREALRELTKSLTLKREIKRRLEVSRTSKLLPSEEIPWYSTFKYSLHMKLYKLKQKLEEIFNDYSPWHKDIKTIESIQGTSVGCYFRFLRYLFLLNTFIAIVVIGFCLIPQTIYNKNEEYFKGLEGNGTAFNNSNGSNSGESDSSSDSIQFRGMDWLTGVGWFNDTELYYGGYISGNFSSEDSESVYNMSYAYFFTLSLCFLIYLCTLLKRVSYLYKINYIDIEEDFTVAFVQKVFSAWDFNITDDAAAKIKSQSIYNELIELIQEYQKEEEIDSFLKRLTRRMVQGVMWFIIVSFFVLLGWGLFVLLRDELYELTEDDANYWKHSFSLLVYPFVVTLIMVVMPILLESMVEHEGYSSQRYELYVTLTRVILLMLTILVVLVLFWFGLSPGLREELDFDNGYLEDLRDLQNETSLCWESSLGQEIYRLVLVDFLVILFSILVLDAVKPYLVRSGNAKESLLTFNIARNTMHIIYNQSLLWAGIFFCPLLPVVISLKFWCIFYLQKRNVTMNSQPRERPWRAAQTETLFYILTLLSFILAFLSYGFILVRGYCSPTCGPFQGQKHYIDILWNLSEDSYRVSIIIVTFILRPGVLAFILCVLCVFAYCGKNIAAGQREMVALLRKQLEIEIGDRVFYLRLIKKVNKGEYIPGSPIKSGGNSPLDYVEESEPKRLSKKSSFIFSKTNQGNGVLDTAL